MMFVFLKSITFDSEDLESRRFSILITYSTVAQSEQWNPPFYWTGQNTSPLQKIVLVLYGVGEATLLEKFVSHNQIMCPAITAM